MNHITILSQLILNPSQHRFIVNFVGEGQALIGEGVPLWGAASKNLIFLLHTPDLIIFSHSPAHPQSNHQPAHRLLIHLTVNCLQSTLPILFYISPLWHDGREFTNWNKKVNLSTNSFLPPPLKIKKLQSRHHTLRELCHSTDLILDTFPKLAAFEK